MDHTSPNTASGIRVIIPAFRSDQRLRATVEAVLNSWVSQPLDVIVVDNGENERIDELLFGLNVVILHDSTQHSAAYARTAGARTMLQGILVFIDDDVIVESTCIAKLIAPILDGRSVATVGNYTSDVSGLTFAQAFKQLYVHHVYSRRKGELFNEFWTAVGAVRADVFHALGGFDTHFAGACGEDMDLGIRLTRTGNKIWAVPDATGKHMHPFTIRSVLRNDYRKGMIAMYNVSRARLSISRNRHASRQDILAVASAVLLLVGLAIALVQSTIGVSVIAIAALSWFTNRSKLLGNFLKHGGIVFAVRSTTLMYVLDDLRAWCLLLGKWKYSRRSSSAKLHQLNLSPTLTAEATQ